jgi:hypothetical protein
MKPKPQAATPRTCDRCREQPGVVQLHSLAAAPPQNAPAGKENDWWFCSSCARLVGRDESEGD